MFFIKFIEGPLTEAHKLMNLSTWKAELILGFIWRISYYLYCHGLY